MGNQVEDAPLTKSEVILKREYGTQQGEAFKTVEPSPHLYIMPEQNYLDMGSPETITVTVEPGDHITEASDVGGL